MPSMIETLHEPENIDALVFDMDGTIADLFGQENWLEDLRAERGGVYFNAPPLMDMEYLNNVIQLFWDYFHIPTFIVSWGSKEPSFMYDRLAEKNKRNWLMMHLPAIPSEHIFVVRYGTDKASCVPDYCNNAVLFDDSEENIVNWGFTNAVHVDTDYAADIVLNTLADLFNVKRDATHMTQAPVL